MTTTTEPNTTAEPGGGRGARERILRAATDLFYRQGINSTGIERLATVAHVSKRTLYQHFSSKDELITAYVRGVSEEGPTAPRRPLDHPEIPARDRLLGVFDIIGTGKPTGCPFVKTAAEIADPAHPARALSKRSKRAFIAALVTLAGEAGAADPDALGHQVALLFDGAQAQGVTLDSREPVEYARALAAALIDRSVSAGRPTRPVRRH